MHGLKRLEHSTQPSYTSVHNIFLFYIPFVSSISAASTLFFTVTHGFHFFIDTPLARFSLTHTGRTAADIIRTVHRIYTGKLRSNAGLGRVWKNQIDTIISFVSRLFVLRVRIHHFHDAPRFTARPWFLGRWKARVWMAYVCSGVCVQTLAGTGGRQRWGMVTWLVAVQLEYTCLPRHASLDSLR